MPATLLSVSNIFKPNLSFSGYTYRYRLVTYLPIMLKFSILGWVLKKFTA